MTVGREGAWFEIESVTNEGYGQRVKGRLVGEFVGTDVREEDVVDAMLMGGRGDAAAAVAAG